MPRHAINTTANLIVRTAFAEIVAMKIVHERGEDFADEVAKDLTELIDQLVAEVTAAGDPKTAPTVNALPLELGLVIKEIKS